MQPSPPLLAGLRRSTFTLVAVLFSALSIARASAGPIQITSGHVHMDETTPVPFDDVDVVLEGAGFALTNHFLDDSFSFVGAPNPAFFLLGPSDVVEFTGDAALVSPNDLLTYNSVDYRASSFVNVETSSIVVGSFVTLPFTLSGTIHGESLSSPDTVDLDIVGQGTLTALFRQLEGGQYQLQAVDYAVEAVPEPGALLLMASGLVVCGAHVWSKRKRR